jgi:tetratricopeptide (TPR) repeat protein
VGVVVVVGGAVLAACGSSGTAGSAAGATADVQAGLAAQRAGDLAKAAADYLGAVKVDPRDHVAWYDLGVVAQGRGLSTSAEHDYERAVEDDRTFVPALYNLGTLLAASSPKTAVRLYNEVIALRPNDAQAHLNLGLALEAEGQQSAGQAQVTYAHQLDPALGSSTPTTGPAK